jgi:tetratricopeptide (TPR) repeat protein
VAVATTIVLTSAMAFAANWPFNNRRHDFIADDYVENLFSTIGPDGLLLTQDWQVASPMLYVQEVEGRRSDVKAIDINLLRRSWYFDYLKHAHPGLMERSRDKIDPYVEILKQWEQDPAAFNRNQELTQRISMAFLEMIQAMVRNEIKVAPVYITNELLVPNQLNSYLIEWIPQTYQLVPQGLVFNVTTDQTFHPSPNPHLQTRGLADGTVRFEKDDVANTKILPAYTRMLINRGKYLEMQDQHEGAIFAFNQALALDPNLAEAWKGLTESEKKFRNP